MSELEKLQSENLKHYGVQVQLRQLQEECGELITSVNHFFKGKINEHVMLSEMADVENVLDQMRIYFGNEKIDCLKMQKMTRQRDRILVQKFDESVINENNI